ncbi:MAG: hypothetical protein M1281_04785 [Chloroflexi bacterium]|nr:hypothetical protein [Chloroflexota bacterium]
MPKLTKLTNDEIESLIKPRSHPSQREIIRKQFIEYLNKYKPGDWISVDLEEGETRQTVKNRLKSAAKELGWQLNFLRTRNDIKFEIQKINR